MPTPRFPLWFRSLIGDKRLVELELNRIPDLKVTWDHTKLEDIRYLVEQSTAVVTLVVDSNLSGSELSGLRSLKRLENLVVTGITDDDTFPAVTDLSGLRHLSIGSVGLISDDDFRRLGRLEALESLEISQCYTTGQPSLASLQGAASLEIVRLPAVNLTDVNVEQLSRLPRLRVLSLPSVWITDVGVASLLRCEHLEVLELPQATVTDQQLLILATLPSLRRLDISDTEVSDRGVGIFKRSRPDVEVVYVHATATTVEQLQTSIAEIKTGQSSALSIDRRNLGDVDLAEIGILTGLTELQLRSPNVTDATLARVAALGDLEELNLSGSGITANGLKHLVGLKQLRRLKIDAGQLGPAAITSLQRIESLRLVHVTNLPKPEAREGVGEQLKQALPGCEIVVY